MFFFILSAKRVEHTMSYSPNVIRVGAFILPSWDSQSCAKTASLYLRNASTGCAGLLLTKSDRAFMYSGFEA